MLATSSGDSTVKIWNFEKQKCVHTFTDHLQAVWSAHWHSCGNFLVSGSRDNTAKIWDLNRQNILNSKLIIIKFKN
jgi:WD40 repeat protein